jgi:perosamine synthetase
MKKTNQTILTAGPSITEKEIHYVNDAIINGWNLHHSDYIKKFEAQFANYIGVKHALATSSCTGALHLALLAMGIGPGDEVIVPETTWIATASAVVYVGAKPIFADIDPKTWVLDVNKLSRYLTKNTKAIIPVHLYGNPVDMDPLLAFAQKNNVMVLEDAAPSIGTIYKGKKTGSFGNAAAFSFQGAKALVTGEGGMFVTNDTLLYEKVKTLWDHGRNPNSPLEAIIIGYKYKMSNLQAAIGLAQIERVE